MKSYINRMSCCGMAWCCTAATIAPSAPKGNYEGSTVKTNIIVVCLLKFFNFIFSGDPPLANHCLVIGCLHFYTIIAAPHDRINSDLVACPASKTQPPPFPPISRIVYLLKHVSLNGKSMINVHINYP